MLSNTCHPKACSILREAIEVGTLTTRSGPNLQKLLQNTINNKKPRRLGGVDSSEGVIVSGSVIVYGQVIVSGSLID